MSTTALVLLGTLLRVRKLAKLGRVEIVVSPLVFDRVVVVAALVIMGRIFLRALYSLKVAQVQVLYLDYFASTMVDLI